MKLNDLTGQRIGLWHVQTRVENDLWNHAQYLCQCVCGVVVIRRAANLLRKDLGKRGCRSCVMKTHGLSSKMKRGSTYRSWCNAKQRCYNADNPRYKDYGARGITMCERWRTSFPSFLADMGDRPPKLSLDRIDVNGNYEPANCRWATASEQNYNRRDSKKYKGAT